jgi:hypothetical protein
MYGTSACSAASSTGSSSLMRAEQGRGDRGVTEHGNDRQWNCRLEENIESAARQAGVVYGHCPIVVVETDIFR